MSITIEREQRKFEREIIERECVNVLRKLQRESIMCGSDCNIPVIMCYLNIFPCRDSTRYFTLSTADEEKQEQESSSLTREVCFAHHIIDVL